MSTESNVVEPFEEVNIDSSFLNLSFSQNILIRDHWNLNNVEFANFFATFSRIIEIAIFRSCVQLRCRKLQLPVSEVCYNFKGRSRVTHHQLHQLCGDISVSSGKTVAFVS